METLANNTETIIGNIIGCAILLGVAYWVLSDAVAIGSDNGKIPGLLNTHPKIWAVGIILALIIVLPIYLIKRLQYKRIAAERRAQIVPLGEPIAVAAMETPGVWPPPPNRTSS